VVEHFSWQHIAEETLGFYRDLLGSPDGNFSLQRTQTG